MTESTAAFLDTSEECIICLCPFGDGHSKEELIVLGCGHRYHLQCIKDQLKHARPDPSKRLLFGGCRCAKCGVFCDHQALQDLMHFSDTLRKKVDRLILEQVGGDEALLDFGRRTFAYYLCSFCQEPYFGGTIECADMSEGELPPEDRLCPNCSPKTQTQCRNPAAHRAYHVWKCRYCCQVATHICYGTVHFCNSCHDRNTERVRRNLRTMDPIPCQGKRSCPHAMPEGREVHLNGSKPDCEQVYYCAWCESSNNRVLSSEPHGSRNLIQNPSGTQGLSHWMRVSPHPLFATERSEIPVDATTTVNFVSGFRWSVMAQEVDLRPVVTNPSRVTIEVSARFMARTDCPSVFRLIAQILDPHHRVLLETSTDQLQAPPDGWDTARLELPPTLRATCVRMIVCGKDSRFWQGMYGAKVAACRIRILGNPDELERILIPTEAAATAAQPGALFQRSTVMVITLCLIPLLAVLFWFPF